MAMLRRSSTSTLPPRIDPKTATIEDVKKELLASRKIEAIKIYRAIHSTDLKDSKDAVEKIESEMKREGLLR